MSLLNSYSLGKNETTGTWKWAWGSLDYLSTLSVATVVGLVLAIIACAIVCLVIRQIKKCRRLKRQVNYMATRAEEHDSPFEIGQVPTYLEEEFGLPDNSQEADPIERDSPPLTPKNNTVSIEMPLSSPPPPLTSPLTSSPISPLTSSPTSSSSVPVVVIDQVPISPIQPNIHKEEEEKYKEKYKVHVSALNEVSEQQQQQHDNVNVHPNTLVEEQPSDDPLW